MTMAPKVFISYAHDSPGHRGDVLEFASFLRNQGVDAQLDEWYTGVRQDWYSLVIREMAAADFVIVVASEKYRRVGDGGPSDEHRGVQAEAAFLRERLYGDRATWLPKILPVILPGHRIDEIPLFLQPNSAGRYPVTAFTRDGAGELLSVLLGRPRHVPPPVGAQAVAHPAPTDRPRWSPLASPPGVWWLADILGRPAGPRTVELHLAPAGTGGLCAPRHIREWLAERAGQARDRGVVGPEPVRLESVHHAFLAHSGTAGFAALHSGQRSAWFDLPAESRLAGTLAAHLELLTGGDLDRPGSWAPAATAGRVRVTPDESVPDEDLRRLTGAVAERLAARLSDRLSDHAAVVPEDRSAAAPADRGSVVNTMSGIANGPVIQVGYITGML